MIAGRYTKQIMYFHTKWYSTYLFPESVGFSSGISVSTIFFTEVTGSVFAGYCDTHQEDCDRVLEQAGGLFSTQGLKPSLGGFEVSPAAFETNVNCGLRCFFGNFMKLLEFFFGWPWWGPPPTPIKAVWKNLPKHPTWETSENCGKILLCYSSNSWQIVFQVVQRWISKRFFLGLWSNNGQLGLRCPAWKSPLFLLWNLEAGWQVDAAMGGVWVFGQWGNPRRNTAHPGEGLDDFVWKEWMTKFVKGWTKGFYTEVDRYRL